MVLNSQKRLRIGAVSYLNTKPLIYHLNEHVPPHDLFLDLPSRLADRLTAGDLDVALIPSVEYFKGRNLRIVSNACIACHGNVRSVRLLFRVPPSEVQTLALDEGSRTSAAMSQVLLSERFGVRPRKQPLPISADYRNVDADAVLIIGDRAMEVDTTQYVQTWDLGAEWLSQTGFPFVFAMWVASGQVSEALAVGLENSRDAGLCNVQEICNTEAPKYGLSASSCRDYFLKHLHFHLGERELAGLQLFHQKWSSLQNPTSSTGSVNTNLIAASIAH